MLDALIWASSLAVGGYADQQWVTHQDWPPHCDVKQLGFRRFEAVFPASQVGDVDSGRPATELPADTVALGLGALDSEEGRTNVGAFNFSLVQLCLDTFEARLNCYIWVRTATATWFGRSLDFSLFGHFWPLVRLQG
ncbi:hypothetical protein [Chitiniphilus shinanonensis]|uniref:hypothetical protein n=1 Tax=Chitiniphilus shinanonensis TaxID=553088 RepID=UPI00334158BF